MKDVKFKTPSGRILVSKNEDFLPDEMPITEEQYDTVVGALNAEKYSMGTKMPTGSCNRCGDCCRYLHFWYKKDPVIMEWVQARGLEVVQESDTYVQIKFEWPCQSLTSDNKCGIHDRKPVLCREFPANGVDFLKANNLDLNKVLEKNCGYKLENHV